MKKGFLFLSLSLLVFSTIAQQNQVQNTNNALRAGELDRAKIAIDLAAEHESTKNLTKMWLYRGKTYLGIYDSKKYKNLDADAALKAVESFINCLKGDKDNVYKDEVTGLLVASSLRLYNNGLDAYRSGDFVRATKNLTVVFEAFPYDKDKTLTRSNITPETLNYDLYSISRDAKDLGKAKEYLQKLVDAHYKSPKIYIDMSRILISEKDTVKALEYIEMGRNLFEDDIKLINAELTVYIQQGKTDVLLVKLDKAIESAPDNELLYYTQGLIYKDKKQVDKAEVSYKKVLDLKADHLDANYELGVLYFNRGAEWNTKSSNLPLSETKKQKEYDENASADFKSSVPYLEKAHELNPNDVSVIQSLMKVYGRIGDEVKFAAMKEKADKFKAKK
ncbi:MAG: hypothetical protein Q8L90_10225 [Bacteroidota bacterium]|nr:hypothetical protein [Bacteroidota bacterium]